jgi:hypothetical protein
MIIRWVLDGERVWHRIGIGIRIFLL